MDGEKTLRYTFGLLLGLAMAAPCAWAAPKQAAKPKKPVTMEAAVARPGSYVWQPERSAEGAVVVIVSLPEQRAHIYRGGKRIGLSTVSTGSEGRETPSGHFEILQKKVMHRSNLYDDAPMPFMQRLTWDGIALHAGHVPGYPASHGCIRLPRKLAESLYAVTDLGTRVIVADENEYPEVVHPGNDAPVDAATGAYIFPDAPPPPPPVEPPRQTVTILGDGTVRVGEAAPALATATAAMPAAPTTPDPAAQPEAPPVSSNPTDRGYQPYSAPVTDPAKRIPPPPPKP
ncbi:hypothetical protein DCD74_09890 [Lysobacter oculi]|uniref:L,D-TPase catalytic domain-containing protein n=1 Tax=Solilutibacter oculi TaxID=2698682 RepID=A0A344J7D5_9GAMM|nr:L,D-transpeptidase family protein [Lysobacter oculi]AXA84945.1 hypothetical protein DCD74_09890 [Lysobacter oculi]